MINKAKALLADHETIDLIGTYGQGNSKVILIANNLVQWGYASISRITTKAPATLQISLKKSTDFTQVCEAFNVLKASRAEERKKKAEMRAAAKAADKAADESVKKKTEQAIKSAEDETERLVLSAVEAGLEWLYKIKIMNL